MKKTFLYLVSALLTVCSCVDEKEGPDTGKNDDGSLSETPSGLPELAEGEIAFEAVGEFFFENKEEQTDGVMLAFEDGCEATVLWVESQQVRNAAAVAKSTENAAYFVAALSKDGSYRAVYPSGAYAGATAGESGLTVNVVVPSVQDGTLAGANISVASSTADNDSLEFRNLCGLLKFSVYSSEIETVTFKGMNGEILAGTLPVTGFDPKTGSPVTGTPTDTSDEIKVEINGKPGTYYAAVLPGLVMEDGFTVSFEMAEGASVALDDAKSDYEIAAMRSSYTVLGAIEDYIPQLDWFVTPEGTEASDGKSWETAISAEQMFQMLAFNRAIESGVGNSSTDVASDAYKETCAAYLQVHNTRHALQLDGTTFHLSEGDYRTTNYVRVSFPELGRQVSISIRGGYDPASSDTDLSRRNAETFVTRLIKPYGSGTARMLFLQKWLNMSFDGLTFYGGTGDGTVGGGALLLNESSSSTFVFRDCHFDSNNSNSHGGAVVGSNQVGDITFEDCSFTGNVSAKDGGAIRLASGKWTFSDCTFSDNQSKLAGGAVNAAGTETEVVFSGCSFEGNEAKTNAGAIYTGAGSFSASDVTFSGNTCTPDADNNGQGGAIYFAKNENATAERVLTRCTFTGNTVSAANAVYNDDVKRYVRGGAVYVAGVPKVTVSGCTFTANEQKDYSSYKTYGGGAIFSVSEISISGTTFSGNKAYYGGALGFNSTATCTDCTFAGNSGAYGGALYGKAAGTLATFTGCTFSGNEVSGNGGAAWLNPVQATFADCDFIENNITENNVGGAIYLSGTSALTLTGGSFDGNIAGKSGGAIYNSGVATINITDTEFSGNETRTADGGAIWNSGSGAEITIGGKASFTGNKAAADGGVFRSTAADSWTITGSVSFSDNEAGKQGGVFCSERPSGDKPHPASEVCMTGAAFTGNKANGGEGGAIIFYGGTWNLTDCSLTSNTATSNGGAIYSNTGTLTVNGSTFTQNSTAGTVGGGAIYVTTGSVLSVDGSKFISNSAAASNGGAIRMADTAPGIHKLCRTHFEGNTSKYGAALYAQASVYVNACSYTGNSASNGGTGGVCYLTNTAFVSNCCFYDNDGTKAAAAASNKHMSDLVLNGANAVVANTTIYETASNVGGIRAYNTNTSTAQVKLYNNVILTNYIHAQAGWGNLTGVITSGGYNYSGAWGVDGSHSVKVADMISTDTEVADPSSVALAKAATADGRGYCTWTAPEGISMTTLDDMTAFLNGVTGGTDFAAWLGTVNGLTHDIAGNPRPTTGAIYPGCYQK